MRMPFEEYTPWDTIRTFSTAPIPVAEKAIANMFRRMLRRVPIASAAQESPRCTQDSIDDGFTCYSDYYHALITNETQKLRGQKEIGKYKWKLPRLSPDVFQNAHGLVLQVQQDERDASHAWIRLRQLYALFEAIERARQQGILDDDIESETVEKVQREISVQITTLEDFEATLPEGFNSQMFTGLGQALFDDMITTKSSNIGISRGSFERLGNHMDTRSIVTVSA